MSYAPRIRRCPRGITEPVLIRSNPATVSQSGRIRPRKRTRGCSPKLCPKLTTVRVSHPSLSHERTASGEHTEDVTQRASYSQTGGEVGQASKS